MSFDIHEHLIPINQGFSVGRGWRVVTDNKPMGVTWHWTAAPRLKDTRKTLQGGAAGTPSPVSAHYCVGRDFSEGIDRYVTLENQSWHAGKNQIIRWDGLKSTNETKASRTCVGIETAHIGYARPHFPDQPHWGSFVHTNSGHVMRIPPWSEEQIDMMIFVGREIIDRWPHIPWEHHHGHHDICPSYKSDVAGFPFARILREIYDDPSIPDVWSPLWNTVSRQRVLIAMGYDLGSWKDDGDWGHFSQNALTQFQLDSDAVVTPHWTTFTCKDAHKNLQAHGLDLDHLANTPA